MDLEIRGLRVMVSAGASGIGLEIARAFVREGARVHVCDVDRDALTRIDGGITTTACDVSDRTQVARFFDEGITNTKTPAVNVPASSPSPDDALSVPGAVATGAPSSELEPSPNA